MRLRLPRWIWIVAPVVLVASVAFARSGGGEHYTSSHSYSSGSSSSGGGDSDAGFILALIEFAIRYPKVGVPLLLIVVVGYVMFQRNTNPTTKTQRAFDREEAARRTTVTVSDVDGWTNALKLKDPDFSVTQLYARVKKLFVEVQEGWFHRDLSKVRPHLSDAMFQRLTAQLELLQSQGIRDAIADIEVLGATLIGLDQSAWFDTVHVRINARMRDADVPATDTDEQARTKARQKPQESFVEVWSFVRKPGAKTRAGQDASHGKCPNCGAQFSGGAANNCEYCGAVVNSGSYDWTLSEITQGVEHVPYYSRVDGLLQAREADPALNLEMLEDRASLIFWKWIRAQSTNQPKQLLKLASPGFVAGLDRELHGYTAAKKRKVFNECAVGGVTVRLFRAAAEGDGRDEAHVELRWSAKTGVVADGQALSPNAPTIPQRWMFVLTRAPGAQTNTSNGMSTNRCPSCNAALTESLTPTCDFCQADLSAGENDWVLANACTYEAWNGREDRRFSQVQRVDSAEKVADQVIDVQERSRLLFLMAMMAAADGVIDPAERKLLKMCSERWSVPWPTVEKALQLGPEAFGTLVTRASPEAEALLRGIVQMALIDGKVDRRERQLLEAAAKNLGIPEKLQGMLPA